MLKTEPLLIIFIIGILLSSCSKTGNPATTTLSDTTYLLNHSRFEQGGNPSLNGWTFNPAQPDDTLDFEMDVPPGAGTWSFKLHTADLLDVHNSVSQSFTNLTSGVYSLTVWLKYKYILAPGTFPPGWISIIQTSGAVSATKMQFGTDNTNWQPQTLLDTLVLLPTDTVTVLLSAGSRSVSSGLHGNPMWVDDISFGKLP